MAECVGDRSDLEPHCRPLASTGRELGHGLPPVRSKAAAPAAAAEAFPATPPESSVPENLSGSSTSGPPTPAGWVQMQDDSQQRPITLCMLTRNEEDRVAASLGAVRDHVARIVVLDAESADRTREIAEELGAEVVVRSWQGFVAARRHLLSLAKTPWVLMIDADEVVEPGLWAELDALGFPDCTADGFQLRRRAVYRGKKLRRAFQPDWKTALFLAEAAHFDDRAVHEAAKVNGEVKRLRTEILHYSYRSAEDQYRRMESYAALAALDLAERGKRAGLVNLWLRPAWRWFAELILLGGFVDGRLGVTMAWRSAYSVHLRYRHLKQRQHDHLI